MISKSKLFLLATIAFVLLLSIGNMVYPSATKIVLNALWFTSVSFAILFMAMGIMAILGMKKEVGKILEIFLESSFSVMDLIDLIRQIAKLFIEKVKESLLTLAPLFSYIIATSLYLTTLYLYKLVGKNFDVTILTILLTILGVGLLGVLNLPNKFALTKTTWRHQFIKKVNTTFVDALEVVLFVFFLTMDSTNLFYVPGNLNVPLRAEFLGYNLMERGLTMDGIKITIILITISIIAETTRNALKIIYSSRKYYLSWLETEPQNNLTDKQKYQNIKKAVRLAFVDFKDELIRFLAFTTALIIVFLTLPRLKLLSMATASVTSWVLDLIYPSRLSVRAQNRDLVSRMLAKLLKI